MGINGDQWASMGIISFPKQFNIFFGLASIFTRASLENLKRCCKRQQKQKKLGKLMEALCFIVFYGDVWCTSTTRLFPAFTIFTKLPNFAHKSI